MVPPQCSLTSSPWSAPSRVDHLAVARPQFPIPDAVGTDGDGHDDVRHGPGEVITYGPGVFAAPRRQVTGEGGPGEEVRGDIELVDEGGQGATRVGVKREREDEVQWGSTEGCTPEYELPRCGAYRRDDVIAAGCEVVDCVQGRTQPGVVRVDGT